MSRLAAQQQALLDALFLSPTENAIENDSVSAIKTPARGLKAYKSNAHALAERVLQAAYPVLTQLLGAQSMGALARTFWHAHPPACGDLTQWGGALPEFVCASEQLAGEPYLADVARVEWALHVGANAADAVANYASMALLTQPDSGEVRLQLAPGCAVLQSPWPVVSLVNAHLKGEPTLAEAGLRLRAGTGEVALIWRAGWRMQVREALDGELALIGALLAGCSLGQALDAAPDLDVPAWLPMAVQTGLLLGASLSPPLPAMNP
jgi:hypothetical protein